MANEVWRTFDVNVETGVFSVELIDGSKYTLNVNEQSEGNRIAAMYHGYEQKIRDAAAAITNETRKDKDGKVITGPDGKPTKFKRAAEDILSDKLSGVDKVFALLLKGVGTVTSWHATSGSKKEKESGTLDTMTTAALAYYSSKGREYTFDQVKARLKGMSQINRDAFMAQPGISDFYQKELGSRAVPSVDDLMEE